MSDMEKSDVGRREVLRKSVAASAGGLIGTAATVGTASADHYSSGTRVEVACDCDMAATYADCCLSCYDGCCADFRAPGEKGTVLGHCGWKSPHGAEFAFVDWDEAVGNDHDASYRRVESETDFPVDS